MNAVLEAVARGARDYPQRLALSDGQQALTYAELEHQVQVRAQALRGLGVQTLGLYADNGLAWALTDLAAQAAGMRCVPLPPFFSDAQLRHIMVSGGIEAILTDHVRVDHLLGDAAVAVPFEAFPELRSVLLRAPTQAQLPEGTQKITFTSGTTGTPKGACLKLEDQMRVAGSLAVSVAAGEHDVHLSLLPLSTLLENLGGLYAPLLAGACSWLLPQAELGVSMSGVDPARMIAALHRSAATTVILVPQLLHALVAAVERGAPMPTKLRFVAVGGGAVSPRLLERAHRAGIPAFEGYGLSECASVVALNRSGLARAGSVGQVLPHARVRIAEDGEILVAGARYLGYVGEPVSADAEWVATGDLGRFDGDGFLYLTGRKKSMFVTAYGRNVSPEWVESELSVQPAIAQVAVFGERRPWNVAVIVPRPGVPQSLADAVAAANRELPEYARIRRWIVADEAFTPFNQQLTANGRVRRVAVEQRYASSIDDLYQQEAA